MRKLFLAIPLGSRDGGSISKSGNASGPRSFRGEMHFHASDDAMRVVRLITSTSAAPPSRPASAA
jgi:hypothetical protein